MRPSWSHWLQAALLLVGGLMVAGCALMLSVNDSGVGQYDYWRELLISSPVRGLLGAVILAVAITGSVTTPSAAWNPSPANSGLMRGWRAWGMH